MALTAQDLANLPLGWDVKNALMRQLGGYQGGTDPGRQSDWMAPSTGAMYEDGTQVGSGTFDPSALGKLGGYTFDWQGGPKNSGTLTALDSAGKSAGTWTQKPEQSLMQGLLEWGALAGSGFGLAGLAGLGPLAAAGGAAAGAGEAAGSGSAAGSAGFNAAMDSQLASSQLGITGAQSAAAATAPGAVNLGSLGGIMSTGAPMSLEALRAAELAGYSTNGALPGSAAVPTGTGGLLSNLPGGVGQAATWMKQNPLLGRLIMGGATSLLTSGAVGGSGGSAAEPVGPAVKWNSPIQSGLLSPVQQYAPPAVQQNRPAGLLAQGQANDGAWRYLRGG